MCKFYVHFFARRIKNPQKSRATQGTRAGGIDQTHPSDGIGKDAYPEGGMDVIAEFGRAEKVDRHDAPKDEQRPEEHLVKEGSVVLQEVPQGIAGHGDGVSCIFRRFAEQHDIAHQSAESLIKMDFMSRSSTVFSIVCPNLLFPATATYYFRL